MGSSPRNGVPFLGVLSVRVPYYFGGPELGPSTGILVTNHRSSLLLLVVGFDLAVNLLSLAYFIISLKYVGVGISR